MAIAYGIDEDSGTILEVWQGETSSAEWIQHVKRVLEDPDLPTGPKWLVEMRGGRLQSGTKLTDVGALAILLRASEGRIRGGRCAIIAGAESSADRLFTATIPGSILTSITFSEVHTACIWLGLQPEWIHAWIQRLKAIPPAQTGQGACA